MQKTKTPRIGIGFRIGLLTVVSATEQRKNGYTIWECRCDCGGSICLDTRTLQRGTVRDCGCQTIVKLGQTDISGQRFGRLVAIAPTQHRACGSTLWRCQCDCGNETLAAVSQLNNGMKKSCGCLGHPPLKDLIGKRFGQLTVLSYAGKRVGMHRWRCRCDCGNETVVGQTLLQTGKTKSCGCLQRQQYRDNLMLADGTSVKMLEAYKTKLPKNNTSGYVGVYQNQKSKKWIAQITFKGHTYYLGNYDAVEDAVAARARGAAMHEQFLDWYYETHPYKKGK